MRCCKDSEIVCTSQVLDHRGTGDSDGRFALGFRLATLTNSVGLVAEAQVRNAGIRDRFELVLSADTVGQGWGINTDWGGLRIYEAMRRAQPDFFIHCGDTIYADSPIMPEVSLPDGTVWKNLVTPAKSKVGMRPPR